jgi:hypothetical protein
VLISCAPFFVVAWEDLAVARADLAVACADFAVALDFAAVRRLAELAGLRAFEAVVRLRGVELAVLAVGAIRALPPIEEWLTRLVLTRRS